MDCEKKGDCPFVMAAVEAKIKAERELTVRRSVFNVFFQTVCKVRKMQKEYFENRTSLLLLDCRKMERQLDGVILRLVKLKDKVYEQAEFALDVDREGAADDEA